MPGGDFSIIVIGASAGGLSALKKVFARLPRELSAAVFVVMHLSAFHKSLLPEILTAAGALTAHHVTVPEKIRRGEVYVAPPNCHLIIEDGLVVTTTGPKESRHRPAINPLFRSAAQAYGSRAVGVILSGTLDDGSAGLWQIKRHGGKAVVQSPKDADFPQMPLSAIAHVEVDYVVPIERMADLLASLSQCETPHEH